MRQASHKLAEYEELRDEVLKVLPDNIDVFRIKQEFQPIIVSKRRFERIDTIQQLIEELERQLLIFPDKRGIQQFYTVITRVKNQQPQSIGDDLLQRVESLTTKLEPPRLQTTTKQTFLTRVPKHIREELAMDLERCGGKDWEHFALGLGTGLKERDKLRIKSGEVNYFESEENGDIQKILDAVLTKFEDNCIQRGVNIDILEHIIDVLKNVDIFQTPLNMSANKIKRERKKLKSLN